MDWWSRGGITSQEDGRRRATDTGRRGNREGEEWQSGLREGEEGVDCRAVLEWSESRDSEGRRRGQRERVSRKDPTRELGRRKAEAGKWELKTLIL